LEVIARSEARGVASARSRARHIIERTPLRRSNTSYFYGARWQQKALLDRIADDENWTDL
jgi:hypothetical protein